MPLFPALLSLWKGPRPFPGILYFILLSERQSHVAEGSFKYYYISRKTCNLAPSASTNQMLGFQMCVVMPGLDNAGN